MLSVILKGYKAYRTYVLVGAVMSLLFGASVTGYKVASWQCDSEELSRLQIKLAKYKQDLSDSYVITNQLKADKLDLEESFKDRTKDIKNYVESIPSLNKCVLDDTGLRLWNGEDL